MHRIGTFLLPVAGLAALALLLTHSSGSGVSGVAQVRAQGSSLSVEQCLEVKSGDTFTLDLMANDVSDLLAWEAYFAYNREIVEVRAKDVRQMLTSNANSNVFDFSDPVPNATGIYRLGAADTGGAGTAESGSGVLARLTLFAKTEGLSWANIFRGDVNGDGTVDIGPTLSQTGGGHIDDRDGDGYFDGPISSGQIAVDRSCEQPAPTPDAGQIGGVIGVNPGAAGVSVVSIESGSETSTPTAAPGGEDHGREEQASPGSSGSAEVLRDSGSSGEPSGSRSAAARGGSASPTQIIFNPASSNSGGGVSTWLLGTIIGFGGAAAAVSYFIYKSARRPI